MSERATHRALLACALLLVIQLVAYGDYFTDDSYIYARFASNLVDGDGLVFNPGERVHAATSPLWALLVAGLVAAGLPVVAGTKALGALCALFALFVLARLGRRLPGGDGWVPWLLVLLATQPWFVRWSASGMETPLAALLVLVAIEAGWRHRTEVAAARLGWSLGLLPLVRPETALLAALVALAALRTPGARGRAGFWIGLCLPFAAWSAFAVPYYGEVLPATLQAKSTPLGLVPQRLLGNLSVLARLYGVALALPALVWFVALLRRPQRLLHAGDDPWIAPALWSWTVALPLVYLLRDVQVVSRYLEVILPVVLVLAFTELGRRSRSRAWRFGFGAEVLAVLLLTFLWIVPSANAFGRSLQGVVEMGEWLRERTTPDSVVAAYDIGAIGYASDRPVLDLGGLVNPAINDLRNRVDDAEILHEGLFLDHGDPDWLVDRDPAGPVLEGRWIRRRRCEAVVGRTVENLGLTRPEPVVYTLYRLHPDS